VPNRKKVTVVGAGNVGATLAQRLFERGYADISLVDIVPGLAQGKALDIMESGPIVASDANIVGGTEFSITAGSDLIIITAGIPRKPGMSRDDLLNTNVDIVSSIIKQAISLSPNAIILIVSNPLDAMVYTAFVTSGFPPNRVLGMSGVLDTARFRTFIAMELNVSVQDVQALVLGCHGDLMVPVLSHATVGGIPLTQLLPKEGLERIVQRTRDGGAEIVELLKTGSAYYAPSAAVAQMADAILLDQKRVLPCCALLTGEFGLKDVFLAVPVKLGSEGVEEIICLDLSQEEMSGLARSARAVQGLMEQVRKRLGQK
jgi:malate dehydrogenase